MIDTVTAGKYVDGTPLYRMAHALARADIEVGRGTLAKLAAASGARLRNWPEPQAGTVKRLRRRTRPGATRNWTKPWPRNGRTGRAQR